MYQLAVEDARALPAWSWRRLPPRLTVAITICFHSACAIASTLITKTSLNSLDNPILLLALQTTVQVVLLSAIGISRGLVKPSQPLAVWRSLIPLTAARLTGVLAKTFCLAAVDAAFYQVARGLLLPFALALSLALLRPRPYFPPLSLLGAAVVMLGFGAGLSSDFVSHLTAASGILWGVGSSFTTAVESVVVKRYLTPSSKISRAGGGKEGGGGGGGGGGGDDDTEQDMGLWQMVWMSNTMAVAFYIPLLLVTGNMPTLLGLLHITSLSPPATAEAAAGIAARAAVGSTLAFLPLAFATGVVGFLLTMATFLQIGVTSPTTHMIVTATRGVAQSLLAAAVLREPLTAGRASSMGLIVGGSALYGWAKDRQMQAAGRGGAAYAQLPVDEELRDTRKSGDRWSLDDDRDDDDDTLAREKRQFLPSDGGALSPQQQQR